MPSPTDVLDFIESNQCLPVGIGSRYHTVRWMSLKGERFRDPLFANTIGKRRMDVPPASEFESDLDVLVAYGGACPLQRPAAVVVHFSRCGSTLLMNALRMNRGVTCLAEPQPFDAALEHLASDCDPKSKQGALVMDCLASAFSCYDRDAGQIPAIVKFGARGMLRMRALRRHWPDVPCIILTRDPIEVIMSNLEKPPRWIPEAFRDPVKHGLSNFPPEIQLAGIQEFIAWHVGQSAAEAANAFDTHCKVIDYDELTPQIVVRIARECGLEPSESFLNDVDGVFTRDAKSGQSFTRGKSRGANRAAPSVVAACERWADRQYRELRRLSDS